MFGHLNIKNDFVKNVLRIKSVCADLCRITAQQFFSFAIAIINKQIFDTIVFICERPWLRGRLVSSAYPT